MNATLKDVGFNDPNNLICYLDIYESSSHTLKMTGILTGILLGLAIFDNKRNSSLKLKQLKIFLLFLYIIVLGFSIMWISREEDFGKRIETSDIEMKESGMENKSLVTFLQNDLFVSSEDADILAFILQLERKFESDLKPSDMLYIKLKTLGLISYEQQNDI